jgi:alkanesulfonate monooxygenase SsuD/methylene tetrahydromethanopterin reductase-like flavin-dependent oxidoreductase (luciferase family)
VAAKIERIHDEIGGFGRLLVFGFDYVEHPQAWRHSLELLANEVLPRVAHLSPARPA